MEDSSDLLSSSSEEEDDDDDEQNENKNGPRRLIPIGKRGLEQKKLPARKKKLS